MVKTVDIDLHHFFTTCIWQALNVKVNRMKQSLEQYTNMFESRISAGGTQNPPGWQRHHAQNSSVVRRHEGNMLSNALNDTVDWQTREWSNFTKFRIFAKMIIISNKKNLNRPDILWTVNKLARSVKKMDSGM